MDGTILANSIYSLKGTDLRIIYSLVSNINFKKLLSFNVNRMISREHNKDYVNYIYDSSQAYMNTSDEEIQVSLFQELNKILTLDCIYYKKPDDIDEQCNKLVEKTHQQYLNQEKSFLVYTKEQIEFTKIHQMVHYQLRQLLYEVEYHYQSLSDRDQEDFLSAIYQYIQTLNEDKRWLLQQHIPDIYLSFEELKAMELSTLLILLSNISLPTFIKLLTELLNLHAEKFSMNIPLIHHDDISPTLKLLTTPFFLTPNIVGGRALQINYQHQAIKKRMLPFILTQIVLPYFCDEDSKPGSDLFLNELKKRVDEYRQLDYQITAFEMKHIEVSEYIQKCKQRLSAYEQQKKQIVERLQIKIHKLKSILSFMDLNELTINDRFAEHRAEYFQTLNKLSQLSLTKRDERLETSLFRKVTNKMINMSVTLDQFGKEKKVNELLELLVMELINSDSDFKKMERIKIKQIQKELEDIKQLIRMEYQLISEFEEELMILNQQSKKNSEKLKQMEDNNYGLKEIVQEVGF